MDELEFMMSEYSDMDYSDYLDMMGFNEIVEDDDEDNDQEEDEEDEQYFD